MTLAADVLANSLYHHFTQRKEKKIGKSLNTKYAVKGYPLQNLIQQLWVEENMNYFTDAIYMHPKEEV